MKTQFLETLNILAFAVECYINAIVHQYAVKLITWRSQAVFWWKVKVSKGNQYFYESMIYRTNVLLG
ncbi:hypothetical protein [Nostoc sp.]|uniref:hypothetical protein n=1 Tax=Nostoc sp. TaxID=1180 RepID=UPI002FF7AFAC